MEVYFDNAATTKVDSRVVEKMIPFITEKFGNPSSAHCFGQLVKDEINKSRFNVAKLLNCSEDEIYFTSGATESNNHSIKSFAGSSGKSGKHVIVSQIEHPCILRTCEYLEENGYEVTYIPVGEDGCVNPQDVLNAIRSDTILVSIMFVNNETGMIQPIEEIAQITSQRGIKFHSDCVQGIGKLPFDLQKIKVDTLSLSAHKIHGPKGVGALFIRKGTNLTPFIHGGSQEKGLRAGTENVPGIIGLGEACRIAYEEREDYHASLKSIKELLLSELYKICDFRINGDLNKMAPNILNISLYGLKGDTLATALSLKGIAVSTGSACSASSPKLSHVLKAMHYSEERIRGAIRISFGRFSSKDEVHHFISELSPLLERFTVKV
ncbi:MAG TPA: cysteine desulfurase family protein [Clostridia bacterium]|nr:cysteine desulfurase family protein [Clostridia bacterium]